jgi:hypothetical protein
MKVGYKWKWIIWLHLQIRTVFRCVIWDFPYFSDVLFTKLRNRKTQLAIWPAWCKCWLARACYEANAAHSNISEFVWSLDSKTGERKNHEMSRYSTSRPSLEPEMWHKRRSLHHDTATHVFQYTVYWYECQKYNTQPFIYDFFLPHFKTEWKPVITTSFYIKPRLLRHTFCGTN